MAELRNMQSKDSWIRHLKEWQRSGLSQAEYCRRNDLSKSSFQWHKSRQKKGGGGFVPVNVQNNNAGVTIAVGSSIRVELLREFSGEELSRLIRDLRSFQ